MSRKKKSKPIPIYKRTYKALSARQKATRKIALEVLTEARQANKSLSQIASEKHISPKTVIRHTNAFKKKDGLWTAKKCDRIHRTMIIYEDGKETSIEVNDSRTASIIGEYHNAVKEYLNTGNNSALKKFKRRKITDIKGDKHSFEIDTDAITDINEAIEEPEFYEIYSP